MTASPRSDDTQIEVDPETFVVKVDGKHATVPAATTLPLTKNYALF